ncbi:unnamed protein product [Vitrella brassicaformis CCMP3155]|uniref:DNA polymerase n=1 Tax=Vitrella brassicaformis (strain CCMP3155) TaxID=1169540 RepID=A0A0G4EBX7_VITBC|nr:unnamed protein product [Vitrella brassicaformis CCMP3155]|eukprot:CEL92814.1 unnamed protein product [Vitrella brassicaformis CCMP3155]
MDTTMAPPQRDLDPASSPLTQKQLQLVPIVRIYGPLRPSGQMCALHVHSFLPFFYVQLTDAMSDEVADSSNRRHAFLQRMAREAESIYTKEGGRGACIFDLAVVWRRGIYGYHGEFRRFVKVSCVNPAHLHRVAALFHRGAVMNHAFQPYEVHLPHLLQFLAEHNLRGMDDLHADPSRVSFRPPLPSRPSFSPPIQYESSSAAHSPIRYWTRHVRGIRVSSMARQTRCELEADVRAGDILNVEWAKWMEGRRRMEAGELDKVPFDFDVSCAPPVAESLDALWQDEISRRTERGMEPPRDEDFDTAKNDPFDRRVHVAEELMNGEFRSHLEDVLSACREAAAAPASSSTPWHQQMQQEADSGASEDVKMQASSHTAAASASAAAAAPLPGSSPSQHPHYSDAADIPPSALPQTIRPLPTPVAPPPFRPQQAKRGVGLVSSNPHMTVLAANDESESMAVSRVWTSRFVYGIPPPTVREAVDDYMETRGKEEMAKQGLEKATTTMDSYGRIVFVVDDKPEDNKQAKEGAAADRKIGPPPPHIVPGELEDDPIQSAEDQPYTKPAIAPPSPDRLSFGTLLAVEVLADCTGGASSSSDPAKDAMVAVLWVKRDERLGEEGEGDRHGGIVVTEDGLPVEGWGRYGAMDWVASEGELIDAVVRLFHDFDPSILVGFEVQSKSIGYFIRRAQYLGYNTITTQLSRLLNPPPSQAPLPPPKVTQQQQRRQSTGGAIVPAASTGQKPKPRATSGPLVPASSGVDSHLLDPSEAPWMNFMPTLASGGVTLGGRIVINLWRTLRSEVKTTQYSLHALAQTLLGTTVPHFPPFTLSSWWHHTDQDEPDRHPYRHFALRYVMRCVRLVVGLMDSTDLLARTTEFARLFGIDFWSVLSRGSQFRVEAMLCRAAHALGYVLLSASKIQVTQQTALECLPLVMEPESNFYWSPVIVLDFQSLYPSIIIAYNICFSTCLGRLRGDRHDPSSPLVNLTKKFGVHELDVTPEMMAELMERFEWLQEGAGGGGRLPGADERCVNILPNEAVFVSRRVRRGVLPSLLEAVLRTRVMVKSSMKLHDKAMKEPRLQRILNHRQFGLKMFSNVTYGYTGASFSGRMPCGEIADAIVQTARRTLERARDTVEANPRWGARVVYGDTDSLFVLVEGRSREDAFVIGREIAREVSEQNPRPMELKMEKVYQPCCLVSKKRYVGYAYDTPTSAPRLDAKGIENVRRDQCPVASRALEQCLRIIFETIDLSQVKRYLYNEWQTLLRGGPELNLYDVIFHREVRLGTYTANQGGPAHTLPPQAVVAYASLASDPTATPQMSERIPFAVAYGPPGSRLIDQVVPPSRIEGASKPLCPLTPLEPEASREQYAAWASQPLLHLNATYYITKQMIPAIDRLFALIGPEVNVERWFNQMPKPVKRTYPTPTPPPAPSPRTPVKEDDSPTSNGNSGMSLVPYPSGPVAAAAAVAPPSYNAPPIAPPSASNTMDMFFAPASACAVCGAPMRPAGRRAAGEGDGRRKRRKTEWGGVGVSVKTEEGEEGVSDSAVSGLMRVLRDGRPSRPAPAAAGAPAAAVKTEIKREIKSEAPSPPRPRGVKRVKEEEPEVVKKEAPSEPIIIDLDAEEDSDLVKPPPLPSRPTPRASTGHGRRSCSPVRAPATPSVCDRCAADPQGAILKLYSRLRASEDRLGLLNRLCTHCAGSAWEGAACHDAYHCKVYFARISASSHVRQVRRDYSQLLEQTDRQSG